jgi:hypothetical protein
VDGHVTFACVVGATCPLCATFVARVGDDPVERIIVTLDVDGSHVHSFEAGINDTADTVEGGAQGRTHGTGADGGGAGSWVRREGRGGLRRSTQMLEAVNLPAATSGAAEEGLDLKRGPEGRDETRSGDKHGEFTHPLRPDVCTQVRVKGRAATQRGVHHESVQSSLGGKLVVKGEAHALVAAVDACIDAPSMGHGYVAIEECDNELGQVGQGGEWTLRQGKVDVHAELGLLIGAQEHGVTHLGDALCSTGMQPT